MGVATVLFGSLPEGLCGRGRLPKARSGGSSHLRKGGSDVSGDSEEQASEFPCSNVDGAKHPSGEEDLVSQAPIPHLEVAKRIGTDANADLRLRGRAREHTTVCVAS